VECLGDSGSFSGNVEESDVNFIFFRAFTSPQLRVCIIVVVVVVVVGAAPEAGVVMDASLPGK